MRGLVSSPYQLSVVGCGESVGLKTVGISRGVAKLLIAEALEHPFSGSIVQLGVQDVVATADELNAFCRSLGFIPPRHVAPELAKHPAYAQQGFVTDKYLFSLLGFQSVYAMDYSKFEGCDYVHDLNADAPPSDLSERFDVVLDGGTMEHVFNVPNVLRNIHGLLKTGGRVIHVSPSSNQVNHGFYSFSPTFFMDYYGTNGWTLHRLVLIRHSVEKQSYAWDLLSDVYPRTSEDYRSNHVLYTLCVAEKAPGATACKIPQQSLYLRVWSQMEDHPEDAGDAAARAGQPDPTGGDPEQSSTRVRIKNALVRLRLHGIAVAIRRSLLNNSLTGFLMAGQERRRRRIDWQRL